MDKTLKIVSTKGGFFIESYKGGSRGRAKLIGSVYNEDQEEIFETPSIDEARKFDSVMKCISWIRLEMDCEEEDLRFGPNASLAYIDELKQIITNRSDDIASLIDAPKGARAMEVMFNHSARKESEQFLLAGACVIMSQ